MEQKSIIPKQPPQLSSFTTTAAPTPPQNPSVPTTALSVTNSGEDNKMLSLSSSAVKENQEEFDATLLKYHNAIIRLNAMKNSQEEIEIKRVLQELNYNLEAYLSNIKYHDFFQTTLPLMLEYLRCGSKNFIKEHNDSQIRQLVLELISRYPLMVTKNFLRDMFPLLYNIIELDNEDNACIAFRILIDLHKRIQKLISEEEFAVKTKALLAMIKKFTCLLLQNSTKILEPYKPYHVRSMEELDLEPILQEIFVATSLQTESNQITLLPRGLNSLKLLMDFPINMIFFTQVLRNETENSDLLNLALQLIVIEPTDEQKANEMFNLEIYTDFLIVQIKYFSFVAYMARQDKHFKTNINADQLPKIILTFFKNIPPEMTSLRKDLLYSTRYIVVTPFKIAFAPYIEEFFNESLFIGNAWATRETLRSFGYSVIFDLVHHLRDSLRIKELNMAVNLYSKNLYDDSLSVTLHVMSCRLLLNISDTLSKYNDKENINQLSAKLLKIFEIFTDKISLMAKYSIQKIKANQALKQQNPIKNDEVMDFNDNSANYKSNIEYWTSSFIDNEEYNLHFGIPEIHNTVAEFRSLSRNLLQSMKYLSTKLAELSMKAENVAHQSGQPVPIKTGYCRPLNIYIFIRLFKSGIKLLEIYNMNSFPNPQNNTMPFRVANNNNPSLHARTKDEKEAIELFCSLFTNLPQRTFRVIVKSTIDYFVKCIQENPNIQQVASSFLSNKTASPVFADILTGYLIERMEVMGQNTEMSNLFLKLFKLVFGSVSLFHFESERMLQPHLRKLVNNSMTMAMEAQEPYNYFMLLRALFRSIGGGSHDQLYREFLPMLPKLLQGLNNFQTGIHRQNMKDLFVELCLTIPVRLSSLLPYLPWLMDPLVSALNGAPNLISQGLRTLELCVDNLQPDFLYAHFHPIRIELMQSLWRTLRYQNDNIAQVSFRILGKLGGTNHRMMVEPQKLDYIEFRDPMLEENGFETDQTENFNIPSHGSCAYINIKFDESKTSIHLPVDKVIEAAYKGLRLSTTDPFYRQQCWEVVKGFLIANIENFTTDEEKQQLYKLFSHSSFSTGTDFGYCNSNSLSSSINFYKFADEKLRKVHELALTAMLTASAIKELRNSVIDFMVPLVRHYTMVAICQQSGPINTSGRTYKLYGMDPLVLVDAITAVMGQEEKELCKPCHLVLRVIFETTVSILGSIERACQLPLYEYIRERVCALCYERAWYSKYGGCVTANYIFHHMSLRWLYTHQFVILKAMFFVMMDLSNDLSSGVIEIAKDNLEWIIKKSGAPLPETSPKDLIDLQQKSMSEVVQELLRQITSSNTTVREQAMHLLDVLAKISGCSVTDVIRPHKELLDDMVPFKKHKLFQQPIMVQIGILDGNTFCITLEPQLFVIDTNLPEHQVFFQDVLSICEYEDLQLQKFPCYKNQQLLPLRKAALRTLSACQHLKSIKCEKVFQVLYKALTSQETELQECAYDCLQKYKYFKEINPDFIRNIVRGFMLNIRDIGMNFRDQLFIQKMKNLARLFTSLFNDKLCELMMVNLYKIMEGCCNMLRRYRDTEMELKRQAQSQEPVNQQLMQMLYQLDKNIPTYLDMAAEIIYLFYEIAAADVSYVEKLLSILTRAESTLDMYGCMVFYKPIQHFMKRYPKESIAILEQRLNEEIIFRFFLFALGEDGETFRTVLYENPSRLIKILLTKSESSRTSVTSTPVETGTSMITIGQQQSPQQVPAPASNIDVTSSPSSPLPIGNNAYTRYQAIKIVSILIKHNPEWLNNQPELVKALKTIWLSDSFHQSHQQNFVLETRQWEEPRLLVKCLLNYLNSNQQEFEMYFQLLRAFTASYNCDLEFLRDFFAKVVKTYSIEWKRNAFLKFCDIFNETTTHCNGIDCILEWSPELKAKVLQYIFVPTFAHAFKNGNKTTFLGPITFDDNVPIQQNENDPFNQQQENLVSHFLNVMAKDVTVSDSIRILVLQLGCLIVEHASDYIRPPQIKENSKPRQNEKVRTLMTYAWPGMYTSKRQDCVKKYYCHLLLTHIISNFSIRKMIIKQVFHNLLKGYYQESKAIVYTALEILIPVLPQRINDGYRMLRQLTKKLLIEENQTPAQLTHLFQIIVRYYRIFYPTRHLFVPNIIYSLQRFGMSQNVANEQRKLALDLVEVIIRWEHERISSEQMDKSDKPADVDSSDSESSFDSKQEQHQQNKPNAGPSQTQETHLSHGSIEKEYSDCILSFLLRFICMVHDFNVSTGNVTQANSALSNPQILPETLCRRALGLLKDALQNEFWPLTDIKLNQLERMLLSVKDKSPNYINICMALELLILFLQTLKREQAIQKLMPLQHAIAACCTCTNPKVVSTVHNLLTKLMAIVHPSCHSSTISPKSGQPVKVVNDHLEAFEQLYTEIHSTILNGFNAYIKIGITGQQIHIHGNIQQGNNLQLMQNAMSRGPSPGGPSQISINSTTTALSQLFSVLMCLKAACLNEPMYIDRLSTPFSLMLQKLVKEHISTASIEGNESQISLYADIINLCLELIKNRIGAFNPDTRKTLINSVFLQLIESSPEVKVIKTLLKIFEEWIKQPQHTLSQHGSRASSGTGQPQIIPISRDKTTLILRVGIAIGERFPNDVELNAQYLELIHYIYSEENLRTSDMTTKLEFAFMSGLRCPQPHIRQKFFNLLNNSLKKSIYERLTYIVTAQNWETIKGHFWIKQAIELILSISSPNDTISTVNKNAKLPLPISLIPLSDHQEKSLFTSFSNGLDSLASTSTNMLNIDSLGYNTTNSNVEMMNVDQDKKQDENFMNDLFNDQPTTSQNNNNNANSQQQTSNPKQNILNSVWGFFEKNRDSKSWSFFNAVSQLCHLDIALAHYVWIQLFPRIYSLLNDRQQLMIASELPPFFTSGAHSFQREAPLSTVKTFFEAVSYCDPPIKFRPAILRYLAKNHNLWHRVCLLLEADMDSINNDRLATSISGLITNDYSQNNLPTGIASQKSTRSLGSQLIQMNGDKHSLPSNLNELFPSELPLTLCQPYSHECMSALSHIYETLKESDYWCGVWHKRAAYKETLVAIAYEQQGLFERAKGAYELAMTRGIHEYDTVPIPNTFQDEYALWELHWIRCSKELNQWDFLLEYGSTPELAKPLLVLESAWRIPDWDAMDKAVEIGEQNLPKDFAWKLALYKGYNALCNSQKQDLNCVNQMIQVATKFMLKEWRRLPHIVSAVHISILQGAHQVVELQEALNLHQVIFNKTVYGQEKPGYDLRSIIKTWKNRLPIVADDLSHWSDIFTWRQHHYQAIVSRFEQDAKQMANQPQGTPINASLQANSLCGAHASAQSLIHLAKVARKHFLTNVALDQLNRIHTIPKVPIVDCFQKIRQQLKCYLLKNATQPTGAELQEAMSVIDCTHLHFFQPEMMAEFIALKGYVLMKMNRMDEANKNLSVSLQIQDTLVKCWAMWGEFNYEMFMNSVKESFGQRNMQYGVNAIISYLHAARHQNEAKTRKYLSIVIWLLSYDDTKNKFASTVEQYNIGVPASNWLPWIPQLLHCLLRSEGKMASNVISTISKHYPEAVYFPTRTLYLTLKMEQREMLKFSLISSQVGINQQSQSDQQQVQASTGMWRCSRIMHHQRELHPTLLTSIEGILDQMSWFRENWFEEILRQLRQALAKCYTIAFENRDNVAETITTPQTYKYIRKLVSTFGCIGIDNTSSGSSSTSSSTSSLFGACSGSSSSITNDQNSQTTNKNSRPTNLNTTASETLARRAQSTVQDPDFPKMKQQFANDFDFSIQDSKKLHNVIVKLKKWIKILEAKTKLLPKSWLLEEKCRYLSNFSQHIANVALPGEYFLPKPSIMCIVQIARFMPRVEIITKHNTTARRLYIRGLNGKIYPYLVLNDSASSEARREERFLHLLRLLNHYLDRHKETARRVINFTVPRVVPIAGQMRFVEDNVSSLSLIEIYKQHMIRRGSDPDAPIAKYYDRLLSLQTKGLQATQAQLKNIISEIQSSMAPKTLLKEWALQTFSTATEFWHFRKLFTLQLGLAGLSEFAFHLTRLNPDMMYIHRDSGLMNISYYRFDLTEETGELVTREQVPFRITHSVHNLITEVGIRGPLTATMIATACCLVHPNYKVRSLLLAIFRDEIINWHKRVKTNEKMALISAAISAAAKNVDSMNDSGSEANNEQKQHLAELLSSQNMTEIPEIGGEELVTLVTKAVNAIMSRLQSLSSFEGIDSNVARLINGATNPDLLSQMDPAWHPWL